MKHRVKVLQVLRIETSTIVDVDAASVEDAIEAISSGEVDLPSAASVAAGVWSVESARVENEEYLPG